MEDQVVPSVETITTVPTQLPQNIGSELVHPATPTYYTEGLQPSGWKIIIPTPMIIESSDPLFAVRLNPFILSSYVQELHHIDLGNKPAFLQSMFTSPIQLLYGRINPDIKILYQYTPTPHLHRMLSHQRMSGTVDLALRVTANTTMSGSVSVTQLSNCDRLLTQVENVEGEGTPERPFRYTGLSIPNQAPFSQPNTVSNYALNDLSLVRHFEISTSFDLNSKWYDHFWLTKIMNEDPVDANRMAPFFRESVLLVSPQTDLLSSETGQITFDLLWDFSKVTYEMPLLPVFPRTPYPGYRYFKNKPFDVTKYYAVWTKHPQFPDRMITEEKLAYLEKAIAPA